MDVSLKKYLEQNTMAHKITIAPSSKFDWAKFFVGCTCGTQGDFGTIEEAKGYARVHMQNYRIAEDCLVVLDKDPMLKAPLKAPLPFTGASDRRKVSGVSPTGQERRVPVLHPAPPPTPAKPEIPGTPAPPPVPASKVS